MTIEKTKSGVTYSGYRRTVLLRPPPRIWRRQGIFVSGPGSEISTTLSRSGLFPAASFVAMATGDCRGRDVTAVTMTGFCDDAAIPTWAKAYAAAGVADGIVQGTSTAEGVAFRGDSPITFNEAATVLNRRAGRGGCGPGRPGMPTGRPCPPGLPRPVGNHGSGQRPGCRQLRKRQPWDTTVTRADAAQMLSAARTLLEQEDDGGLFGWLS